MTKEYKNEIVGGVWLFSALLILLTIIYPKSAGVVGTVLVGSVLWPLIGRALYILPLVMSAYGMFRIFSKSLPNVHLRTIGLSWFFIAFCVLVEIFSAETYTTLIWPMPDVNGGYIGYVLSHFVQKSLGIMPTYILLVLSFYFSFLLVMNWGIKDFFFKITGLFNNNFSSRKSSVLRKTVMQKKAPVSSPQIVSPVKVTPKRADRSGFFRMLKSMFDFNDDDVIENSSSARKSPIAKETATTRQRKTVRPTLPRNGSYIVPRMTLLKAPVRRSESQKALQLQVEEDSKVLEQTLLNFKVEAKVVNVSHGPSVTRYELMPAPGVRVNKISNLADDISLVMAASVRIEAPVPGKSVVGIEVPNRHARAVNLSELTEKEEFYKNHLTVALGLDIAGHPIFGSLNDMPHLLIAGATGSGKSVCVNSLIMSILLKATPKEVNFLMIDPKRVELMPYNGIPHLIAPVVDDPNLAHVVLKTWAIKEMERRYRLFSQVGVRNIEAYNKFAENNLGKTIRLDDEVNGQMELIEHRIEKMPYTVIIIDELADLMMVASRDVEGAICRLAQMARATGIHLVIATQRPSVDVITGLIKANIPSRIAFSVGSQIDSRTIIDVMGAEKLLGKGDMLYSPVGARHKTRVQGVFVSDEEVHKVVSYIKKQAAPTYQVDLARIQRFAEDSQNNNSKSSGGNKMRPNERDDGKDVLFDDAAQVIAETGKNSISFIQRKLRIGYNRAARIMDELVEAGVVNKK